MALPTYLQLVNNVLTRLRETTVSSVNDTEYSRLIKVMVNDSKREIEHANDWTALRTSLTITTAAGVDTYTLTGSGRHFEIKGVYNTTERYELKKASEKYVDHQQNIGDVNNTQPYYYSLKGVDSSTGDAKVRLFPAPDGVYSLEFEVVQRQDDLVNDSDAALVPGHLIELLTQAKAIAERGEDGGQIANQTYQWFLVNLSDAIAIEKGRSPEETTWEIV